MDEGRAAGCQAKRTAADNGRLPSNPRLSLTILFPRLSFSSFGGQKFSPLALSVHEFANSHLFRWTGSKPDVLSRVHHEEPKRPGRRRQGMPGNREFHHGAGLTCLRTNPVRSHPPQ